VQQGALQVRPVVVKTAYSPPISALQLTCIALYAILLSCFCSRVSPSQPPSQMQPHFNATAKRTLSSRLNRAPQPLHIQGRCHVVLVASSADQSSLQSVCEDYMTLHKLARSDVHVHTIILTDPPGAVRREEQREISRLMQQVERQEPHILASERDASALFYSFLHGAVSALLQASSLDWFVASPSAPGFQPQRAAVRADGLVDDSRGGGSTTRRSDAAGGDNAPSWLTMDGQVCRCFPRFF
jgi:hypothetical protein